MKTMNLHHHGTVLAIVCLFLGLSFAGAAYGESGDGYSKPGDFVTLLGREKVQRDLALAAGQAAAAGEISERFRADLRAYYADLKKPKAGPKPGSAEDIMAAANKRISALLSRDQMNRLIQIGWQIRDGEALFDEDLARVLGMTGRQKDRLSKAGEKNQAERRALMDKMKGLRFRAEEARQEYMAPGKAAANKRLLAVLSPAQRVLFAVLKGDPIER